VALGFTRPENRAPIQKEIKEHFPEKWTPVFR
jgi:hypothetical protein